MAAIPTTIHLPAPPHPLASTTYHLCFITGNPGLIGYYTRFLQTLHSELNDSPTLQQHNANVAVYGRSLSGFEVDDDEKSSNHVKEPLGLQEQIDFVDGTLRRYVTSLTTTTPSTNTAAKTHKIILLGHSVGAYILLTLLSSHLSSHPLPNATAVTSGICLFPTVVDIAASPSGRHLGWLLRIPGLPGFVAGLVKGVMWVLGEEGFGWVVGTVTGMGEGPKGVTVGFLGSGGGVEQALHMAADELLTITSDKWDSRIWGSAPSSSLSTSDPTIQNQEQERERDEEQQERNHPPKLFFYFGQNDHWVADRTRDDLIAARGRREPELGKAGEGGVNEDWKPRMEVDTLGVPHGFCVRDDHSAIVARKCRVWIEDVVAKDLA